MLVGFLSSTSNVKADSCNTLGPSSLDKVGGNGKLEDLMAGV